jgi:hypothetical protein
MRHDEANAVAVKIMVTVIETAASTAIAAARRIP